MSFRDRRAIVRPRVRTLVRANVRGDQWSLKADSRAKRADHQILECLLPDVPDRSETRRSNNYTLIDISSAQIWLVDV